jgi:altronate hydrolase
MRLPLPSIHSPGPLQQRITGISDLISATLAARETAIPNRRGSLFGSRPAPCLKISTTSGLYERMRGDIDFDAGPAMGHTDQLTYGTALFEALVDMASGTESKSEVLGFGTEEIVPWRMAAVL